MSDARELAILLTVKDFASAQLKAVNEKIGAMGTAGKLAAAGTIALATAGAALVGGLTKLAEASAKSAGEVAKLKRETGLSAEEASKLRYEGARLNIDVDGLSKSFGILSKSLESAHPSLEKYNIAVVHAKDGHIDMEKTLGNVADRFKAMPDGVEKTALSLAIFGKQGKDMIPLLNQGSDGLKSMGDEAAKLGLVFDNNALAAAKRYSMAQKDLSDSVEGLKNRIGMAFLPILADAARVMVNIADKVLPPVVAGFDKVSGGVRTLVGVVHDMGAAISGQQLGGGDFLASIIGPKAAGEFMALVTNVGLTFNHIMEKVIRPAFEWLRTNVPTIWDAFKNAVMTAWNAAQPVLGEFVKKFDELKTKFEALPAPVQKWAEATVISAAAVHATGLDQTFMDWANALGNFGQVAQGGTAALVAMGASALVAAAAFGILLAGIGVVIFVGSHLDDLEAAWTSFAGIVRLLFAALVDHIIGFMTSIVRSIEDKVNLAIGIVNLLWTKLGNPPIPYIHIELPNADNVSKTLDQLTRDRTVHVSVIEEIASHAASEHTSAGIQIIRPDHSYASGTPYVPRDMIAMIHKGEAIIPASQNAGGYGGGVTVVINGDVVGLSKVELVDQLGAILLQQRRIAGLA